ncbi:MAG: LamG domain-containing protein [Kiritimatiellia bacterium]
MKTRTGVIALIVLFLTGWSLATAETTKQTSEQIRVELDLVDGSRVIGVPAITSIPLQTSYASMDIPLEQMMTLGMAEDHETAEITLGNGDKLSGIVKLKPIRLDTLFGDIRVGIAHIRRISILLPGGQIPDQLRRSLVLYYSFDADEAGTVKDDSGNGHDGVLRGAKWTPDGYKGGAYVFSGYSSFIEAVTPPPQTGSLSVAAWIRTTQMVHGQRWIVTRSPWQHGAWQLMTDNGRGASEFYPQEMFTGQRFVADGQWHHLVTTYDDATGERLLYVDGELDAKDMVRAKFRENAYPIQIGKRADMPQCFEGTIDEVMIFNRALSGDEVRQLCGPGRAAK